LPKKPPSVSQSDELESEEAGWAVAEWEAIDGALEAAEEEDEEAVLSPTSAIGSSLNRGTP